MQDNKALLLTGQFVGGGRNYAIDLLRIISMFMILVLHGNTHGRLLSLTQGINFYSIFFHFGESLSIVSVNMFVLISGYYLSVNNVRISRIIKIVLATWFYAWVWLAINLLVGRDFESSSLIVKRLAPISFSTYWFIPVYLGMLLLSPYLNVCINNLTKNQHRTFVLIFIACFSLWPSIVLNSNPFGLKIGGFNLVWFVCLYIIAAYIRKFGLFKMKNSYWFVLYLAFSLILLTIWIFLSVVLEIRNFAEEWKGLTNFYFFKYNSIFVLFSSICLFRFFLNLRISNSMLCKAIRVVAPLMIGVYLISDNKEGRLYIWDYFINIEKVTIATPFNVTLYFFAVFSGSIAIEWLRTKLFKLLENRQFYIKLSSKMDKFFCVS